MIDKLIFALAELLTFWDLRLRSVEQQIKKLNESITVSPAEPEPIKPEPIEPEPIEPEPELEPALLIVKNGGKFEAVPVDIDTKEVLTVVFTLNGEQKHTERVYKYEYSPKKIPDTSFTIMAALTYKDGRPQLIAEKIFETVGTPLPPETGGEPVTPPPPPTPTPELPEASIEMFDLFVANADGTYYDLNPDQLEEGILSLASQVAPLFNTGESHYGLPENRVRIVNCPPLNRKGFTFLIDGSSDTPPTFARRFASQKTNGGKSTLYPTAKSVASYTELYFASAASGVFPSFTMREHFKSSSFTSRQGPPSPGSNHTFDENPDQPRLTQPGQAEVLRFGFYGAVSQPANNNANKGDMMALYFGQETYWSAEDRAKFEADSDQGFIMGTGAYTAHLNLPYKHQNMLYPCKPDEEGNPTRERFLMPTDKLIKTWMIWNANTLQPNGDGNYDGTFYWWLQIDGVNGDLPWLAGIVTNHLWTTGQRLEIGQVGLGAYFNQNDAPNQINGFFVLRDIIYYLSY